MKLWFFMLIDVKIENLTGQVDTDITCVHLITSFLLILNIDIISESF